MIIKTLKPWQLLYTCSTCRAVWQLQGNYIQLVDNNYTIKYEDEEGKYNCCGTFFIWKKPKGL